MSGDKLYCELSEKKDKDLFKLGMDCIKQNLYIGAASKIFQDLTKKDKAFCDGYFFAGVTFRISNMNREAFLMYYMADSLSQNKSIEFKQNLATTSILVNKIDLARKKYTEITNYFPKSPEGYYGIALTAPMIGDFENGLENIKIAINKYEEIGPRNSQVKNETELLLGILLTLNKQYENSLSHFEECEGKYKKDDNFNTHFSYSLIQVSKLKNDEKMKKKAFKIFDRIISKDEVSDEIKKEFKI